MTDVYQGLHGVYVHYEQEDSAIERAVGFFGTLPDEKADQILEGARNGDEEMAKFEDDLGMKYVMKYTGGEYKLEAKKLT